jgi:hypothetical protein
MRQLKSQDEALTRSAQILREMQFFLKCHGRIFKGNPVYAYSEYMSITDLKGTVKRFQNQIGSLHARSFINSAPKASKPAPGSALFMDVTSVYSSPFVSSVDRLLEG